ncbi:MAG: 4-hydroxybenzoate polyprenyltransferase [Novosphingobium sp. 16-62-11]|nr:MAG: 4-hydroxybenzoate polyprenyltransferase [Novosphingobium sp. 16-62-11]
MFLGGGTSAWVILAWFLLGAVAMRGAGCVYNDIVDADLDARVARTALRPIASGAVTKRAAWIWLLSLCAVGFVVLLQLRWEAQLVALGSLALVAAYPFMKRITGWPQAWLGLVFTWGAPVGWVQATGFDNLAPLTALYAGCWAWCMAYDTIYAMQDREDDALVGIGSSALSFGQYVKAGVAALYALALACWAGAVWLARPDPLALLALLPVAVHLAWQVLTLKEDGTDPLVKFRSNRTAGLLMAAACYVVGAA